MKAIVISEPGGPEVLQMTDRPVPEPGAKEVLVRVMAAGINRPDIAQRKGRYPAPPGAPADIPGLEIAGIIEQAPENSRWKTGDRVCALIGGGGYAEYACVPEGQCLPIPEKLSYTEAAALPETFFTVWHNVFERGKLQKGDRFLVHGGSGGIGTAAIQLAHAWGAEVYTTAGSEEKCRFCEELGATRAINYHSEDFEEVLMGLFPQPAVHLILDMIGGEYTSKNIRLLAEEGRLVQINVAGGREAAIDLLTVMQRRLLITGSTLRARPAEVKSSIARQLEQTIWPLLASGAVKPVIHAVFPLEEAAAAHELMGSGAHRGKIVLECLSSLERKA